MTAAGSAESGSFAGVCEVIAAAGAGRCEFRTCKTSQSASPTLAATT